MKPNSAGFLIQSCGLYLLGHVTQSSSYIFNPIDRLWTIPKGIVNTNESLLDCAIRETIEETGFDVRDRWDLSSDSITPKFIINTKYKVNHIFYLNDIEGTLVSKTFKCGSLIQNKRLPHMDGKPEIDMFIWANREQAQLLIHDSLKVLFVE